MLRGVITITKEELQEASNCIKVNFIGTPLESKVNAAIAVNMEPVELQLSDLEVEQMLDCMGAPMMNDPESKKKLRCSLQTFIAKLKGL